MERIWTMGDGIYLEMIGFHPNRHLGKSEKHRCEISTIVVEW